jgi:hypothetical protein
VVGLISTSTGGNSLTRIEPRKEMPSIGPENPAQRTVYWKHQLDSSGDDCEDIDVHNTTKSVPSDSANVDDR